MEFYSFQFFTFFAIVVAVFFATSHRYRWIVLLGASYYFYGAFKVGYAVILAVATLICYWTALRMGQTGETYRRKTYLLVSLFCSLGLLFVFKYYAFFWGSLATLLGIPHSFSSLQGLNLAVPIGISFYVFGLVSYSVDVYRGGQAPEKHLGIFALYVAFFPKLLAGPIERAKGILAQLREDYSWDWERITDGLKLMTWGLFKKVVIADRLASFVEAVYGDPTHFSGVSLTLATIFYSVQIYCDFSGYTDIAIGISQVFGYRLMDNFNRPYGARSVGEFWRRWHISLSTWLRDYLYIPLGGSRMAPARLATNLIMVFLICGLWHGANWTFVAWGLIHGVYLVSGRFSQRLRTRIARMAALDRAPSIHRAAQVVITFCLVSFAWVFFRAESLGDALYIVRHLPTGWGPLFHGTVPASLLFLGKPKAHFFIAVSLILFLGVVHLLEKHEHMRRLFAGKPILLRWALYYVLVTGVLLLSAPSSQRFIYFQF